MKHVPLRAMLALVCLTALDACDRAKSGAEAAVRESLKDPDSAKFGAFYYNEKTHKGCLTVNAKNTLGGYTGDQQAYLIRTDKGWNVGDISDFSHQQCRELLADETRDPQRVLDDNLKNMS